MSAAADDAHRPFLDRIAADPADDARWLVYADWLEEVADTAGAWVRLFVALARGGDLPPAERHEQLRGSLDPAWLARAAPLWAERPLLVRVTEVRKIGNIPPREMFDRAMTFVIGFLVSGRIRRGDEITVPLSNGELVTERVWGLETFAAVPDEIAPWVGRPEFVLAWPGHRLFQLGVAAGSWVRSADGRRASGG